MRRLMRYPRIMIAVVLTLLLDLTACGGDKPKPIQGVERTQTTTSAPSGPADSTGEHATVAKSAFYACVGGTDLKLAKQAGQIPGAEGTSRANFELDGVAYAGFVVWPSGDIADVW